MKIINPSVEKWQQRYAPEDIWEHVAKCARVCYQSEAKEGENGYDFCRRVILNNNHLSVLEHGTVYLITMDDEIANFFKNNPYSRVVDATIGYCITTNLRVLKENDMMELLEDSRIPTEYHERRTTFSFITSIGISREINRHRKNSEDMMDDKDHCHSISEESTRYCNYTKGKFGNEITFIKPYWIKGRIAKHPKTKTNDFGIHFFSKDAKVDLWLSALEFAELEYNALIAEGCKPQEARSVLPLDTKTQCIHTAFNSDWDRFIKLRTSNAAHPDARRLANQVNDLL